MRLKTIIGIVLIVASFSGIVVWECVGRSRVSSSEVLVAAHDIEPGSVVSVADFMTARVEKNGLLEGVLSPQSAASLEGLTAKYPMSAGQQVLSFYVGRDDRLAEGESFYVLPSSWIYSRSSLTEEGDECSIYLMPDERKLGSYTAVLVGENVEIICSSEEYFRIYEELNANAGSSLLIVIDRPEWRQLIEKDI